MVHELNDDGNGENGSDRDELVRAVTTLHKSGAVVEVRAFHEAGTHSGYFNEPDLLADAGAELDRRGAEVYVTMNEIDPALFHRRSNKVRKNRRDDPSTSDKDVLRRIWILVDFDPKRPGGVSSTDEEKEASRIRAVRAREFLRERGWPEPILCDSGNGYHLLYRIDLPADSDSRRLIERVLKGLDFLFSDDAVGVDTSTYNAGRITKFYGVTAKKGEDSAERPHRPSRMLEIPESLERVDRGKLEEIASVISQPDEEGGRKFSASGVDLPRWISDHDIEVLREGSWDGPLFTELPRRRRILGSPDGEGRVGLASPLTVVGTNV
jgi:hypothetical protein